MHEPARSIESAQAAVVATAPHSAGTSGDVQIASAHTQRIRSKLWPPSVAAVSVLAVWLGMSAALFAYVAIFSRNLPYNDDWELVPELTGTTPLTVEWLFARHNEHRFFVPRAVLLVAISAAHLDFRAGPFLDTAILSLAALGMILTAFRLRGRARFSDAVFPLLCVNFGHYENLLYNFPTSFILVTGLASLLLIIIVLGADGVGGASGAAVCTILMPLCGVQGLMLCFPAAMWLVLICLRRGGKLALPLAGAAIAVTVGMIVFCRPLLHPHGETKLPSSTIASVTTALKMLGMAVGPKVLPISELTQWAILVAVIAALIWMWERRRGDNTRTLARLALAAVWVAVASLLLALPSVQTFVNKLHLPGSIVTPTRFRSSGPDWGILALAVCFASAGLLLKAWWRQPGDRSRQLTLLLYLVCLLALSVALGYGRAGGESASEGHNRHRTLMVPVLCCAYFIWELYGGQAGRRLLPPLALVAAAVIAVTYIPEATSFGAVFAHKQDEFRDQLRSGQSAERLTAEHAGELHFGGRENALADCMVMLRNAGHPAFVNLPADPERDARLRR